MNTELDDRYYLRPAAAFVRGMLGDACSEAETEAGCIARALNAGVDLHRFKRAVLPRVRRVLGMLEGLLPASLLDVGCGRGAFVWPLIDQLRGLQQLIALEVSDHRLEPLRVARQGGLAQVLPLPGDVTAIPLVTDSVQTVTILEVLEHLPRPALAAREVVRVARQHVIASVPSKPDDNPQHLQLFDGEALSRLFLDAGARKVQLDYVLNHIVLLASV